MRAFSYLFIAVMAATVCRAQAVLEVRFAMPNNGSAILYDTESSKTDTLGFDDGSFVFEDQLDGPTLFHLVIDKYNNQRPLKLVLSPEKTLVDLDSLKPSQEGGKMTEIYPNRPHFVEDPNNNQAFYAFHYMWMNFYDAITNLSHSNSRELLEKRKRLYRAFIDSCDAIIRNNRHEFISAIITDYLIRDRLLSLDIIQRYYDYLAPTVKDSFFGLRIGEYAGRAGRLQPGKWAPAFDIADIRGNKYDLTKLRGKKVLLHFWSSTCAPCIKEAPDLINLSQKFEKNVTVINVSLDTNRDQWIKGMKKAGIYDMNNVCDLKGNRGKIAQDYLVQVIPTYHLIDEEGKNMLKGSLNQVKEVLEKSTP